MRFFDSNCLYNFVILFFLNFYSETISNIPSDNASGNENQRNEIEDESNQSHRMDGDPVFSTLNEFLNEDDDFSRTFRPISPSYSETFSPTTTISHSTSVTPSAISSVSARSTKRRRQAAANIASVNAETQPIDTNKDQDLVDIMSTFVTAKIDKGDKNNNKKKELTATEIVMDGLTKMLLSFPAKDRLEMTNDCCQRIHARALEIESRPQST